MSSALSVVESECCGLGDQFIDRLGMIGVNSFFVGDEVVEADAAVATDFVVGNFACFDLLDQVGTRDVESIGGFLGGEFGVDGDEGDGVALGHLGQDIHQRST
jgi:hypothetical protein